MAHIAMVVSNPCAPDPRVLREASWLTKEGHEVQIHAFDRQQLHPETELVDGVSIIRYHLGIFPYGGLLSTHNGLAKFRKAVSSYLNQHPPEVIFCHDADTLHVGCRLRSKHTIPLIFDMHDLHHTWILMPNPRSLIRSLISRLMKRRMLNRATRADVVVTSSDGFRDWMANYGIECTVVENRPCKREPLKQPEQFTIGYFGRIREIESFNLLAAAIDKMETPPCVKIAGDGVAAENVRAILPEAEFHGAFDSEQLQSLMAGISVMFAMYPPERGNISDGAIPAKMFDAASFGRPSVVNAGCPMGELCEVEGLGIAVPWGNEVALAQALTNLNGESVELQHDEVREKERLLRAVNGLKQLS